MTIAIHSDRAVLWKVDETSSLFRSAGTKRLPIG